MACTCGLWSKDARWRHPSHVHDPSNLKIILVQHEDDLERCPIHSTNHVPRHALLMCSGAYQAPTCATPASISYTYLWWFQTRFGRIWLPQMMSFMMIPSSHLSDTKCWRSRPENHTMVTCGHFHIFLCTFAYLGARNEKLEYFKLSEGACPSQQEERSHIYKPSHSFIGKILSKRIFSLAFGSSLVLANLSCRSGIILCLWYCWPVWILHGLFESCVVIDVN